MLLTAGRAHLDGAPVHGRRATSACRRCRSPARRPASSPTPTHSRAKIIEVKGDRIREALADGKVAIVAGFQGVSTDREITTLGPRRLRPHRGRARGRARRRRLRDLHRRRGRLHRRSAHRAAGAQARRGSRSTRCSRWRRPAAACSRCGRSSSPATTTCACTFVRASPGRPGTWVTEEDPSMTTMEQAIISGVTHDVVRGEGHDRAGARPSGRRRARGSARSPTRA